MDNWLPLHQNAANVQVPLNDSLSQNHDAFFSGKIYLLIPLVPPDIGKD